MIDWHGGVRPQHIVGQDLNYLEDGMLVWTIVLHCPVPSNGIANVFNGLRARLEQPRGQPHDPTQWDTRTQRRGLCATFYVLFAYVPCFQPLATKGHKDSADEGHVQM